MKIEQNYLNSKIMKIIKINVEAIDHGNNIQN